MKALRYTLATLTGLAIGLYMVFPIHAEDVRIWDPLSASPEGFPENMAPSGVNDTGREVMNAISRWLDDTQPTIVSTGSANAYAMAASQTISSYITGDVFAFIANFANTSTASLNVDGVGEKEIFKADGSGLSANDIIIGQQVVVGYSATADSFQLLSTFGSGGLSSPVGVSDGGTGATSAGDARTNLGVAIGSDVAAFDTGLDAIADAATTAGNILSGNGTTWIVNTLGNDDEVLTADSATAGGVKWQVDSPRAGTALTMDPYVIATAASASHGLGATPDNVKVVLEALSADLGYPPGSQILLSSSTHDSASSNGSFTIQIDATAVTIYTRGSNTIQLNRTSDNEMANITAASWKLIATPYLY